MIGLGGDKISTGVDIDFRDLALATTDFLTALEEATYFRTFSGLSSRSAPAALIIASKPDVS